MEKIILLLILAFVPKSLFAECAMSGMQFFPEQKTIDLNSMFIIQGYSFSQQTINSFKDRKIYLESENGELIELKLQEILKGQMQLTQAIFCGAKELKPNTKYYLKYSDQTKSEGIEMYRVDEEKGISERVFWQTTNNKSSVPLNPDLSINFEKTEVVEYGCGPSANAIFNVNNDSKFEVWYKTELIDLTTNNGSSFYLKAWNGKLNVGHSMCSGAFTFKGKGKYKVRFTPMNIDGMSIRTTDWYTFVSPFVNDESPFGY